MRTPRVWTIHEGEDRLGGRLQASFRRLYDSQPEGLIFTLSDTGTSLLPWEDGINFVIGLDAASLVGYARCTLRSPMADIGAASMLDGLRSRSLLDLDGSPVIPESLSRYEGYSSYRGTGPVLHIGIMDIFVHRKGFGTMLLDHIKGMGFELIELEANGKGESRFFSKNGFVDTGIDSECGAQLVMVWNNPEYLPAARLRTG